MDRKPPPPTDSPDRLLDAAIARHQQGDLAGAVALYREILTRWPGNVDAGHLLGLALWQSGEAEEGLQRVKAAAEAAPKSPAIQNNLGGMLMAVRQFRAAERAFRAALAVKPDLVDAQSNLAAVLLDLHQPAEAEKAARQALALAPTRADAWANRGVALLELGRFEEAEQCQRKALSLNPDLAVAHANLGTLLRRRGMTDAAVPCFQRALELDGNQPVARFNLALDHLVHGRLEPGWADYEERFRARLRQPRRELDIPFWQGDMLTGRHLLIWPEQGLGDEILFSSIFPDMKGLDGPVTVECDARLVPLFARSFPHLTAAAMGATPAADLQIAAGSLPRMARPVLSRFPGRPWLLADGAGTDRWRRVLDSHGPALNVGFCWRSGLKSGERVGLYPSLSDFAPLFALPGIRWVPLQYDLDDPATLAEMKAALPVGINLFRPDIDLRDNLDGVAALTAALDLVISAGTAVSELSGALGVPVWRIGGEDEWTRLGTAVRPWYATMRCYTRQAGAGFTSLLSDIARDLTALMHQDAGTEDADDLHRRGHTLVQQGKAGEAVPLLERAALLRPADALLLARLGGALRVQGQAAAACDRYRQSLALRPGHAVTIVNIARCLLDLGELDAAEAELAPLLSGPGTSPHAHDTLGLIRQAREQYDAAAAAHRDAVTTDPTLLSAWINLGAALRAGHHFAEAAAAFRTALDLSPDQVEAWTGLAYALFRLGNPGGAEAALDRALALVPDYPPAITDLSRIREIQGREGEALALLDRLLATHPGDALARWNRSHLRLSRGDLAEGWADYRARFAAGQATPVRRLAMPEWRGQDITGKRLLVWREQGLGDEILWAGLIADLRAVGIQVIVECDRRLTGLLSRSFQGGVARAETPDPRDADFHCPLGDLPAILRPDLRGFGGQATGWMKPDPARVQHQASWLNSLPPGLRVGFCWRSQRQDGDRKQAYLSLADLMPLLTLPGIVPVSLQYDGAGTEIAALRDARGVTVHQCPDIDLKDDLEGTTALMAGLDLVICAPTAVGEMAAALGVPVWRFQNGPDWSALGTAVRPWYPAMRLFMASPIGQVVPAMVRELTRLLQTPTLPLAPPTLEAVLELHRQGDLAAAEQGYRAVLRAQPDEVDALHLLSQVLLQGGRAADALPLVDQALALDPEYANAHNTRGSLLKALGRFAEAEKAFRQTLSRRADHAEAWSNLGATLVELRRYGDAEKASRRALAQRPDYPRALVNLGVALRHLGRWREAADCQQKALSQAPDMPDAWGELGLCRTALGDAAGGRQAQEKALSIDPTYAEAAVNLSLDMVGRGDGPGARTALSRALSIRPGFARALYNDALLALGQGDLKAGWTRHEARFDSGEVAWGGPPSVPRWDGTPLAGRRLLVWGEQGLGDQVMMAAHYGRLSGLGGPITIWTDPRLVPILARAFPFATVMAEGTAVEVDCHVPAGSLPLLLAPNIATWDGAAFLAPRPDLTLLWRDRLAALPPGLRIGLCWRSQLRTAAREAAYTDLSDWLPLLRMGGVQVISLQYDGAAEEIAAVEGTHGVRIHRWDGVDLRDDLDTALALTAQLDLVITVATAVGEMAGAIGVPVWRLSGPLDWTRLGTAVRPWFASMRVFTPAPQAPMASQVPAVITALTALLPGDGPDGDPSTWLERGIERQKAGDPAGAMPFYRAVIAREGEPPVALHLLGLALQQTGLPADGLPFMMSAVAAAPDYAAAWVNLGNLYQTLDRPAEAEGAYRKALALRPLDPGTWTNLGNALRALGRLEDAVKAHGRAIGMDKGSAIAHGNLAAVLKDLDRLDAAEGEYRLALTLGGPDTHLHAGLGDVLRQRGQLVPARAALQEALRLDPGNGEAWNNLGRVAEMAGDPAAARRDYDHALAAMPGLPTALYNRGLLDLTEGALEAGWNGYAMRFRGTETIRGRHVSLPIWDGSDIADRRLLVWGEQGLGDQLMFAALYPALAARCGHLVIEGDQRLTGLLARAFPMATVRPASPDPRDADVSVAAGDVAGHLWSYLGDLSPHPYLTARPDLVAGWRDRLATLGPELKVGICWRSSMMTTERRRSYAGLSDFAPLAAIPGVSLIGLQRGLEPGEVEGGGVPITRFDDLDLNDDLEGQAALITALDLVITVPTAVGELAGALGVPVWRLGRADWTGLGTAVRPWFPSMRRLDSRSGMAAALTEAARLLISARRS
jgi:tetratricopeptide (TPR) repeat protein/ADP-heptose:LPS heptosyltransferase